MRKLISAMLGAATILFSLGANTWASPSLLEKEQSRPRLFPIQRERVAGFMPHLPEAIREHNHGAVLAGSYMICVERDGGVGTVKVVTSIAGGDPSIESALRTWHYRSQGIPFCFREDLKFVVP